MEDYPTWSNIWHCDVTQIGNVYSIELTLPVPIKENGNHIKLKIEGIGTEHTKITAEEIML